MLICFYVFMRTTIELPPELMREAKAAAAKRGETLKQLFSRAIAAEVGRAHRNNDKGRRVRLPLFGDPSKPPVDLTNEDIERILAQEDAEAALRFNANRKRKVISYGLTTIWQRSLRRLTQNWLRLIEH